MRQRSVVLVLAIATKMSFTRLLKYRIRRTLIKSVDNQILTPHVVPGEWARRYEGRLQKIANFDMEVR